MRGRKKDKRLQLDSRYPPCYKCRYLGDTGESTAGPIGWCYLQQLVVAPEAGCSKSLLYPK